MLTNASCTLYHKRADGGYDRAFIPECFWMDARGASVKTGGIVKTADVTVYIPEKHAPKLTAKGDILVRGDCPHVFDNTTDKTISDSLAALREAYDIAVVAEVEDKRYGRSLRHIKVTAS